MINIDQKKLVNLFFELVKIDAVSLQERAMADYLSERLNQLDIPFEEDNAGNKINGNSGNILARFYSESGSEPPLLITCHMDTVTSTANVKPVIQNGVIASDGKTILGADNRAGMAMILYVLENISCGNRPHRNLEIVFSVAEELGMWGMTHVDFQSIESREGYVLDCSRDVGCYVQTTPGAIDLHLKCSGKAAHSGIAPEKGINALSMAMELLDGFPIGRIDAETTTNIGTLCVGTARNIVPDKVSALGEIRSFNPQKMEHLFSDLQNNAEKIAAKYGGTIDVAAEKGFTGFNLDKDLPVIRSLEQVLGEMGITPEPLVYYGGSDANVINEQGITAVNLGIGAAKPHSNEEFITIDNMVKGTELLLRLI